MISAWSGGHVGSVMWSGGHTGSVMWALLVATLVAGSAAERPTLHCRHEGCRYIGNSNGDESYEVEGHKIQFIMISYAGDANLILYCNGANVLESPALPRFEPARQLQALELFDCTLPVNRSLADTLATLNVVITKGDSTLLLFYLKVSPTLASKHFAGLDYLDTLYIAAEMPVSSERGFLASLRKLRTLVMSNVTLHASELEALPPSLHYLELHDAGVDRLSDAIRLLGNLTTLFISSKSPLDAGVVPPGLRDLELQSPATTLRLDAAPALKRLSVYKWTEPLPPPLARCDKLREVHLMAPAMHALPEGWLANCSRLQELVIENARNLTTLPPTLLPTLDTLTRLALRQGALESLPEGLLYGVGTIESLELDGNRLQTLPSGMWCEGHAGSGMWCEGHAGSGMWALLVAALVAGSAAEVRPPLLHCRHESCRYNGYNSFEVEGHTIRLMFYIFGESTNLWINCNGASVLESPALPRFEPAKQLRQLTLYDCPLSVTSSLVGTLTKLSIVRLKGNSSLRLDNLKDTSNLAAKHFAGLDYLHTLYIKASDIHRVSSERGFLAPLRSLKRLTIANVTLPAGELDALPPSLQYLELHDVGVKRLPDAIRLLVNLRELIISSKSPLDAGVVPPGLSGLELQSPATTLRLDVAPALETLSMDNWTAPLPPPLARCDALQSLHLRAPAMRALPEGWLANCSRLQELVIENAQNLTTLPPTLLPRLDTLTRLALKQGALESLPEGLLDGVYIITSLELDGNRLQTLPRNIFKSGPRVSKLFLSANDLDGAVRDVLMPIRGGFNELDLSHNPRIGDLCNANNDTKIFFVKTLKKLLLNGTGATRICQDWRLHLLRLETLDLSGTNITELSLHDLLFTRTVWSYVSLLGAPVHTMRATYEDYNYAAGMLHGNTTMHIDAEFECDCRMYWVRRALDLPALAGVQLRCVDGGLLRNVPLGDMMCARREVCAAAALPDACACAAWTDDDPDHNPRLVRVRCENASLARVPRLPVSPGRLYELLLANNRITHLDADDLQDNINRLDLRNNSLMQVDKKTANKLGHISGMVQLAGNPLECNCSAAPLLRALHNRARNTTDLDTAKCRNGSGLYAALIMDCPQPASPSDVSLTTWLAGTLAVVLALALAATAWLASREWRFFARAVLHRWGFVWRAAEPPEDGARRYDAFLTFSHKDEDVARELLTRLEPPYQLCVHHRDWTPGCFISEQVVESVRESRRTVALVSRHFLQSSWALAEFREAHAAAMLDARPRLVVVLLEEPHALQMDATLRRYVTTHTYLQWGERYFWEKMKLALPPPRPAPPDPPSLPHQQVLPPRVPTPPEPMMELLPVGNPVMIETDSSES